MKNLLLLAACVFLFVSSSAAQKTSLDYAAEGSKHYIKGDYAKALPPCQKAVDLEKKERKLEKNIWIVVLEYGISKGRPTRSLSSPPGLRRGCPQGGVVACGYGELGDEDNAINYSSPPVLGGVAPVSGDGVVAFKNKANTIAGERFPNPETDSSFARFRDSEKFKKAIAEMK